MADSERVKNNAKVFVAGLERFVEEGNRGALVRLKGGFRPSTEKSAYPFVARCLAEGAEGHEFNIGLIVGGCYGISRNHSDKVGDLGTSLCRLASTGGVTSNSIDRMAGHVISARNRRNLYRFIESAVRRLASVGVPINFERLYEDLNWWNAATSKRWARSYYLGRV